MSWSFERAHNFLKTARDPYIGKPVENNTRVILRQGDMEKPERICIKHHATNIVTFYPDGSRNVVPWNSMSTKARLWTYGGVRHFNHYLPAFNGRVPDQRHVPAFSVGWGASQIAAAESCVDILHDDTFAEASIEPAKIKLITDKKAAHAAWRKARKMIEQIEIRTKLGVEFAGHMNRWQWLRDNLDRPLNQIDYEALADRNVKGLRESLPAFHYELAECVSATRVIELKILPTSAVTI